MNDMACIASTSNTSHEEMKQTALKRDEEQVQAIVNHLNETMTDPFDIEAHSPCLMNISTGKNQSTSENNFWIDMTGYDFTRFAIQGCFGIHVFKCFQF
jgi:hypothetical protein